MIEHDEATEWWWIDYLENEMELHMERDLELLLQHSAEDRAAFEHFRVLREWLRGSDPVGNWPVEERVKRVEANVMEAIGPLEAPGSRYSALNVDTKSLRV